MSKNNKTIQNLHWCYRLIISLLLVISAYGFFYYPYTKDIKINENGKEITIKKYANREYGSKIVGTFFLIFLIWLWKNELDIRSFGPLADKQSPLDESETQNNPKELENNPKELENNPKELENNIEEQNLMKELVQYVDRCGHISNMSWVTHFFRISISSAKQHLYKLVDENKIIVNFFKTKPTFISKNNIENKAIDWYINKLENNETIISKHKFLKIQKLIDIDGVIETNRGYYLIEVKILKDNSDVSKIKHQISKISIQLQNLFPYYNKDSKLIFLIIHSKIDISDDILNTLDSPEIELLFVEHKKLENFNQ